MLISQEILFLQSIPSEMEFDPNSNPPCYKTVDEARIYIFFFFSRHKKRLLLIAALLLSFYSG